MDESQSSYNNNLNKGIQIIKSGTNLCALSVMTQQIIIMSKDAMTITLHQTIIHLDSSSNLVSINIQDLDHYEKYRAIFSYEGLPYEFKVLFENLQEFFVFLKMDTAQKLKLKDGALHVVAQVAGKLKEYILPLQKLEPTKLEKVKRQNIEIKKLLQQKENQINAIQQQLKNILIISEDIDSFVMAHSATIKSKETQIIKLNGQIRSLQNSINDIICEKPRDTELRQSRITQEFTPKKIQTKSKKALQKEEFGQKITFHLSDTAKYYSKFKIIGNQVQKLHGPTYQLFHHRPLPNVGRFYFDIKIVLIKNNNIVVGVITDENKGEQFSFKKINCVCYNGYDGSICQQEKQRYVIIKPKEGQRLRTVIDNNNNLIQWYVMGGQMKKLQIGQAKIPECMSKQELYPYFQLYWQGNKIKLNS